MKKNLNAYKRRQRNVVAFKYKWWLWPTYIFLISLLCTRWLFISLAMQPGCVLCIDVERFNDNAGQAASSAVQLVTAAVTLPVISLMIPAVWRHWCLACSMLPPLLRTSLSLTSIIRGLKYAAIGLHGALEDIIYSPCTTTYTYYFGQTWDENVPNNL